MQNLSFNDGYKEFSINGDETRVIRVNPSDFALIERFNTAIEDISLKMSEIEDVKIDPNGEAVDDLKETAAMIKEVREYVNEKIDYIFNGQVSAVVFGNQSPLSSPGGITLVEGFLNAIGPVLNETIQADVKARDARIKKYTSQVKKR